MWDPSLLPPSLSDLTLATPSLSLTSHKALLIPNLPSLALLLCPACSPHEPVTIILDPDHSSDIGLTNALNTLYTTGDASLLALEMGLQEPPDKPHLAVEEVIEETPEEIKQEIQNQNEGGKECKLCNLTFALESSLRKHMKICALGTSSRWECSICAERFQFRRMLTSHRKDKHAGKLAPKIKTKLECETRINNLKSEESVGDFLFVQETGDIDQYGYEELKDCANETFDQPERVGDPNFVETGIGLPPIRFSPIEESTRKGDAIEITERVAGVVPNGTDESDISLSDASENLPDVTTLLENWRTKMLKG